MTYTKTENVKYSYFTWLVILTKLYSTDIEEILFINANYQKSYQFGNYEFKLWSDLGKSNNMLLNR